MGSTHGRDAWVASAAVHHTAAHWELYPSFSPGLKFNTVVFVFLYFVLNLHQQHALTHPLFFRRILSSVNFELHGQLSAVLTNMRKIPRNISSNFLIMIGSI